MLHGRTKADKNWAPRSVAECLTNLVFARCDLANVKMSGNWMFPLERNDPKSRLAISGVVSARFGKY